MKILNPNEQKENDLYIWSSQDHPSQLKLK